MKIKSTLLIACKMAIVIGLVWYLPTKVGENVHVIEASTQQGQETAQEQSVATPVSNGKKIYIYNTHQSEEYADYNVVEGAKHLQDKLNSLGYACDVEGNSIVQYMSNHNLTYDKSYTVSKMYLEQQLSTNGTYDLIIDFHRDSVDKSVATVNHGGTSYAKVMFVVGKSSGNYENVNQISESLAVKANERVPGISRGVYEKSSHYNQGTSDNMILIEVGATGNTKEEVQNTVQLLAEVIHDYLGG